MSSKISNKILALTLIISITAIVIVSALSFYAMYDIKGATKDLSKDISNQVVKENSVALEAKAIEKIKTENAVKRDLLANSVSSVAPNVKQIADKASNIYKFAELYDVGTVSGPVKNSKAYTAQLVYTKGQNAETLGNEVSIVSNIKSILLETSQSNESILSSFIYSNSGFIITGDKYSSGKFDTNGKLINIDIENTPWYQKAVKTNSVIFSDVYYDLSSNPYVICASPFTGKNGIKGISGVAISLAVIKDKLATEGTTTIIFNNDKNILFSTSAENEFAKGQSLENADSFALDDVKKINYKGKDVYASTAKAGDTGLYISTIMYYNDVIAPAIQTQNGIIKIADNATKNINTIILYTLILLAIILIILVCVASATSLKLSMKITNPIKKLKNGVECVGEGNLDYKINVDTHDEIQALANTFNEMGEKLKAHTDMLISSAVENERKTTELNLCSELQNGILTKSFPEKEEFEIFADCLSAETGGTDFYDAYMIDNNRVAIFIENIKQSGFKATAYGLLAKELTRAYSTSSDRPCEVVTTVNKQLCVDENTELNITMWLGILEISSGKLIYVNAGHTPPVVKRSYEKCEYLPSDENVPLMQDPEFVYKQESIVLRRGDLISLITDGILNSSDESYNKYGKERLTEVIEKLAEKPLNEFLPEIKKDVEQFIKGAPQLEDFTILTLKMK